MTQSQTLNIMLSSGVGYRNEGYSASPYTVPTLLDMLEGEIEESGNTDILDYIEEQGYHVTDVKSILEYVESTTHKNADDLNALWLTTKQGVADNYMLEDEEEYTNNSIVAYSLDKVDPLMVLSDLDEEGALFITLASEKEFIEKG